MTQRSDPPLDRPPRRAHFRRAVRNLRRGYNSIFALVILVLAGWALLDAYRWVDLTSNQQALTIGFGVSSLFALFIWRFVDNPLRRELRLARRGEVARGQIVGVRKGRRRRAGFILVYTFRTTAGESVAGECRLPRRVRVESLAEGSEIEVLYDARDPQTHKPRLALEYVEFGDGPKKVV